MPQAFKKYTNEKQDGRKRLLEAQREAIRERYKAGGVSMQGLANEYGVSKGLILILVNPKSAERVRERIKKHWRDYQKKGKEWAKIQKKARDKKRVLGLAYNVKR